MTCQEVDDQIEKMLVTGRGVSGFTRAERAALAMDDQQANDPEAK